jgi:hypothetical protein
VYLLVNAPLGLVCSRGIVVASLQNVEEPIGQVIASNEVSARRREFHERSAAEDLAAIVRRNFFEALSKFRTAGRVVSRQEAALLQEALRGLIQ